MQNENKKEQKQFSFASEYPLVNILVFSLAAMFLNDNFSRFVREGKFLNAAKEIAGTYFAFFLFWAICCAFVDTILKNSFKRLLPKLNKTRQLFVAILVIVFFLLAWYIISLIF